MPSYAQMTNTKYSISAASRMTSKSRTTIKKHLAEGKLSYGLDANGAKVIDVAELMRVYGNDLKLEEGSDVPQKPGTSPAESGSGSRDVKLLQEQLDREIRERVREREQYREQVAHLQQTLALAQEGHNRATLLLEKQPRASGEWEQGLKALEEKLSAQEQRMQNEIREIKENASRRIARYKQALAQERERGFWNRLWAPSRRAGNDI